MQIVKVRVYVLVTSSFAFIDKTADNRGFKATK